MSEWTPITSAPAKRGEYMVANADSGQVRMAKWYPMSELWKFPHWQQRFDVTHWQPIPKAP